MNPASPFDVAMWACVILVMLSTGWMQVFWAVMMFANFGADVYFQRQYRKLNKMEDEIEELKNRRG